MNAATTKGRPAVARKLIELSKRVGAIAADLRLALAEAEGMPWADALVLLTRRLASDFEEAGMDVERGRRAFPEAAGLELPLVAYAEARAREVAIPAATAEPIHRSTPDPIEPPTPSLREPVVVGGELAAAPSAGPDGRSRFVAINGLRKPVMVIRAFTIEGARAKVKELKPNASLEVAEIADGEPSPAVAEHVADDSPPAPAGPDGACRVLITPAVAMKITETINAVLKGRRPAAEGRGDDWRTCPVGSMGLSPDAIAMLEGMGIRTAGQLDERFRQGTNRETFQGRGMELWAAMQKTSGRAPAFSGIPTVPGHPLAPPAEIYPRKNVGKPGRPKADPPPKVPMPGSVVSSWTVWDDVRHVELGTVESTSEGGARKKARKRHPGLRKLRLEPRPVIAH